MKWGLKGGISIYADSGPPRCVLWCCSCICHKVLTFIQVGCGHTVIAQAKAKKKICNKNVRVSRGLDGFISKVSWVIKGWWHRFRCVIYGPCWDALVHSWQKCKQKAKNNTYYRFLFHHPLITQLDIKNMFSKVCRYTSSQVSRP